MKKITSLILAVGALGLLTFGTLGGWAMSLPGFGFKEWLAVLFLGIVGCALTFNLWVWALEHTTPTRVAVSVTANPIVATLLGAHFLGEAISATLLIALGLVDEPSIGIDTPEDYRRFVERWRGREG